MSDNKSYYYLKLKENFFESEEIKLLESIENGYLYSNILLKMYLKSLKNEGRLMFREKIPYNSKMLATITGHNSDVVEKAIKIFVEFGLIQVLDSGAIYISDIQAFIGESSSEADRKREYRLRISQETKCLGHLSGRSSPELEIEKELDIEKEKNIIEQPKVARKRERKPIDQFTPEFEVAWSCYPTRNGSNCKTAAFRAWRARAQEGISVDHMTSATKNYQSICIANGQNNTPYVMQGQRFYGPNKEFEQYIATTPEDLYNASFKNQPKPNHRYSAAEHHAAVSAIINSLPD